LKPVSLSMKRHDSIQILRAIAALLVVYVHSLFVVSGHAVSRQSHFFNLTNFGACGVDIFFAISGFILSTVAMSVRPTHPNLPHGAIDFLLRRFLRIFPIYWILSFFFVLVQWKQHHLTLAWLLNSYLLLPSLRFPMPTPLIFIGWTLIFEMFFYYLLTLNLFFGVVRVVERTILTILAFVVVGGLLGFHQPVLILLANPLNIEFTFGCLIGLAYARFGKRHALGNVLLAIGSLWLLSTLFFGDYALGNAKYVLNGALSWPRVFLWGIPAAMITAGLVFRSTQITSVAGRFGVFLGDASYSIYLVTLLVFYGYDRLYPHLARLGPDTNVVLAFLSVALIGPLCYLYVERPVTRFLTAKYHRPAVQSAP
jgi:exopolysaccharide production protein ExoZ